MVAVKDDGCGIDSGTLHSGREGHWGLTGMRERADSIGANLQVFSNANAGGKRLSYPAISLSSSRPPAALLTYDRDNPNQNTERGQSSSSKKEIATVINEQTDMRVVAQAATGREAIQLYRMHRPDVTFWAEVPDMGGVIET